MSPRRHRQQRRDGRRRRRFDPMQRAEDFTTEPSPRTSNLTPERRMDLIESIARSSFILAGKPPTRQLLETVLTLPEASALDVGRQIILRRGAGIPDVMYIGMQLGDDSFAWFEMSVALSGVGRTWVSHISSTDPYMIAISNTNAIYVSNFDGHRIREYSTSGVLVRTLGTGTAETAWNTVGHTQQNGPVGLAWAQSLSGYPRPILFVAQNGSHIVTGYSSRFYDLGGGQQDVAGGAIVYIGSYAGTKGSSGSSTAHLSSPFGLATDGIGDVYIADTANHRIQRFRFAHAPAPPINFQVSATYIQAYSGATHGGAASFNSPRGLAIDSSGLMYVADGLNHCVRVWTTAGFYQFTFGSSGTGPGQFNTPSDVALDALGYVHVVDRGNNRVQVFDTGGNYVTHYGGSGSGSGQFNDPTGIAFDSTGVIYVVDRGNDRISVWV